MPFYLDSFFAILTLSQSGQYDFGLAGGVENMSLNDMGAYGGLSIDEEATSHELGAVLLSFSSFPSFSSSPSSPFSSSSPYSSQFFSSPSSLSSLSSSPSSSPVSSPCYVFLSSVVFFPTPELNHNFSLASFRSYADSRRPSPRLLHDHGPDQRGGRRPLEHWPVPPTPAFPRFTRFFFFFLTTEVAGFKTLFL